MFPYAFRIKIQILSITFNSPYDLVPAFLSIICLLSPPFFSQPEAFPCPFFSWLDPIDPKAQGSSKDVFLNIATFPLTLS